MGCSEAAADMMSLSASKELLSVAKAAVGGDAAAAICSLTSDAAAVSIAGEGLKGVSALG